MTRRKRTAFVANTCKPENFGEYWRQRHHLLELKLETDVTGVTGVTGVTDGADADADADATVESWFGAHVGRFVS